MAIIKKRKTRQIRRPLVRHLRRRNLIRSTAPFRSQNKQRIKPHMVRLFFNSRFMAARRHRHALVLIKNRLYFVKDMRRKSRHTKYTARAVQNTNPEQAASDGPCTSASMFHSNTMATSNFRVGSNEMQRLMHSFDSLHMGTANFAAFSTPVPMESDSVSDEEQQAAAAPGEIIRFFPWTPDDDDDDDDEKKSQ